MSPELSAPDVNRLMAAFRHGDQKAAADLVELFYPQLRRLANTRMKQERAGHSWQPTLLVNELYLELTKIKALRPPEQDGGDEKNAFFGLAAHLMRRLLVHHSRPLAAKATKVDLENVDVAYKAGPDPGIESVTQIEAALARLEGIRPRLREVVELKVFEGMTTEEVAEKLDCSPKTVSREWDFAKHWLQREFPLVYRN